MSDVVVISVVRNFEMYERLVKNNPFNQNAEFVVFDNNKENVGISARYNSFLENYDYSKEDWFVFCHEDWELKEDILPKLENLDKNCLYGPVGIKIKNLTENLVVCGSVVQTNKIGQNAVIIGNDVDQITEVGTFDCQCIIVHSSLIKKYDLRFDENLKFDLYVEDFCINAKEKYSVLSKVVPLKCQHYSYGKVSKEFYNQLKYLRNKYKKIKRVYGSIVEGKMISSASRCFIHSCFPVIMAIVHFFYQSKITRKGNKLIKIFKLPIFQMRVGKSKSVDCNTKGGD